MTEDIANTDRADWLSQQERDLYEAAGIKPGELPEQTRRVVRWLAGWDDHTVSGLSALLASAWHEGSMTEQRRACVCPEGDTLALCRVHGLYGDGEGNLAAAAREVVATVATLTDPVMGALAAVADEWDWVVIPRDRIDALAETLGDS